MLPKEEPIVIVSFVGTLAGVAAFAYYVTHGTGIVMAVISAAIVCAVVSVIMWLLSTVIGIILMLLAGIAGLFTRKNS